MTSNDKLSVKNKFRSRQIFFLYIVIEINYSYFK